MQSRVGACQPEEEGGGKIQGFWENGVTQISSLNKLEKNFSTRLNLCIDLNMGTISIEYNKSNPLIRSP